MLTAKGRGKRHCPRESLSGVRQARIVITPRRVKVEVLVDPPELEATDPRPMLGCDVGIKDAYATLGISFSQIGGGPAETGFGAV